MIPPLDPTELPATAQKVVAADAPQKLQLMAAKGVVPGLKPDALLTVIVILSGSGDAAVARQARETLERLPELLLRSALDADLVEAVILELAHCYLDRPEVIDRLIRMPRVPIEAIDHMAQHGGEAVTELVAINQERILANPHLVELLYLNRHTRMSTADRLVELAVRHHIELRGVAAWKEIAQAIQGELIVEASDVPLPEDEMFWETDEVARELSDDALEDAFFEDEDGGEQLEDKLVPLYRRLAGMTVSQRIRRAMLGTKEERMMLIREQNKLVAAAAARSPLLKEPEVVQIARNRGIAVDVLRIIGMTPEWMKSYQVKKCLVENAKTPISISQRLITQLRESDLRRLAKDKNVPSAVQQAARRHLDRRAN